MSISTNIVAAVFGNSRRACGDRILFQRDRGQVLTFPDLADQLPPTFQVWFANHPEIGTAVPQTGADGRVAIPDTLIATGRPIWAWLYLHTGEDDGETYYTVTILNTAQPAFTGATPTPAQASAWDEAIAELNEAIETADAAASHGPQIRDGYWYTWDPTSGSYVDSGVRAVGENGRDAVIDSTLSHPGEAADAAATGAGLASLRGELYTLLPVDLAEGVTLTSGKYVDYSSGAIVNSAVRSATDYIDISDCEKIVYSRIMSAASSGYAGIAFYNASKVYVSGIRMRLNAEELHYELSEATVPENAVYVRLTKQDALGAVSLFNADDYYSKVPARLDAAEEAVREDQADILSIRDYLEDVAEDGYFLLDESKFALGGWQSYASADSRAYRVRYTEPLQFDRDVLILAAPGYAFGGYYSSGDSIGSGLTVLKVPANTTLKVYVRAYTEDTSSTADVAEYAKAIKFSTALAPIEMDEATHTDISMFCRVGISGDSYAAGGGIISGVTELTWGKNLERQSGVKVDIYARSGASIVDWVTDETKGLPALLNGAECGLYWFQHGINGTSTGAALGTPADMSADPHPSTFYGQYVEAVESVKSAFPSARIVLATPVWSSYGLTQSAASQRAVEAVKEIAEYCQVPCIEVTDDDFFRSPDYGGNTLSSHPTAMVAAGMAMAYRRLLSKCILDNPAYFRATVLTGHGDGAFDYRNLTHKPTIPSTAADVGAIAAPDGGSVGQVLKKTASGTEWANESGGGGGTSDYTDLTNKPQINSVTLTGNKSLSDLGIEPEAFVVTITQSGSTYSADKTYSDTVAAISAGKRVVAVLNGYEYQLFNYVPNNYTVIFSANQGTAAKTIAFSLGDTVVIMEDALGKYSKPSGGIPATDLTATVQASLSKAETSIQFDSQTLTDAQKAQARDNIGAASIDDLGTVFDIKGDVATVADLPATGNRVGDVYYVQSVSAAFVWLETTAHPTGYWEEFGEPIDLSGYIEKPSSASANQILTFNGSAWVAANKPSYTASEVGAVAVAQGVAHAGEFVVVGSDGNITTVTMSVWQGGSY